MKRPAPWLSRRIETQKALRNFPPCKTPGCKGKATGIAWGSLLCPQCKWGEKTEERKAADAQRAQREKTP
jgi:hypothetical protein